MTLAEFLSKETMSQTEFAERLGVSVASVSRYLSGERHPSAARMRRIRELTDGRVTADDLVNAGSAA